MGRITWLFIFAFFLIHPFAGKGQDLSNIGSEKPVQVRGSIGLYSQFRSTNIKTPYPNFGWAINGNLNLSLYGISIPLSVSIRNDNRSFSHPFNNIGISPTYKWIKVHAGHRSMNFSPYIYSGHRFLGGGIELTPGNFRFAAFIGKMQSFYPANDEVIGVSSFPTYDRKAYGVKIGYGSTRNFIDLIAFRAQDQREVPDIPDSLARFIKPENNLGFGVSGMLTLFKVVQFRTNLAASIFSGNLNASTRGLGTEELEALNSIIEVNRASRLAFAGDASLRLTFRAFNFGVEYSRINPSYRSLGVYYLVNDREDITIQAGAQIARSVVSLKGKIGLRRNNLENYRSYTQKRVIYSFNASVRPVKPLLLSGSYSNIESEREPGFIELADTLRYAQTTSQFQGTLQLNWGENNTRHTISGTYLDQGLNEVATFLEEPRNTNTSFIRASYAISFKETDLRLSAGFQQNNIEFPGRTTARTGFFVTANKRFFDKKLSLNARVNVAKATLDGADNGNVLNLNAGAGYRITKKHNIRFNIYLIDRQNFRAEAVRETRGNVSYTYSF